MIEIQKENNDKYLFQLKTSEGQTLLKSIVFDSREEIDSAVAGLSKFGDAQGVIERKTNYQGNFLFNLKDKNGRIIGKSLLYDSEAGMENGISNLKKRIASIASTK